MASRSKEGMIREVKETIQFAITVAVFFSAFTYTFFKSVGAEDAHSNGTTLAWGIGIAAHILSYLLVDLIGRGIQKGWFAWLKASLVIGIIGFITPILVFAASSHASLSSHWIWPFKISLQLTLWMPILTLLMIVFHLDWVGIKEIYGTITKKLKR